jgi:hypothetical protein
MPDDLKDAHEVCNDCKSPKCHISPFPLMLVKIRDLQSLFVEFERRRRNRRRVYDGWIFRGQLSQDPLWTSLERACDQTPGLLLKKRFSVERTMMREFARTYTGEDRTQVIESKLYCLSLMQHHGSPTRLLDWTYSPYVALYFALQYAQDARDPDEPFSIWCLDSKWCWNAAEKTCKIRPVDKGKNPVHLRRLDKNRQKDPTFETLYMRMPAQKLVCPENPYFFHSRLLSQRGVFLCPGDISISYEDNLLTMVNKDGTKGRIIKFCCLWNRSERQEALDTLNYMNISRTSLFPGIDGYAQSLKYRLPFFENLDKILNPRGKI